MDPKLYRRVREKEGRIYTDEIVRGLPVLPNGHPLHKEWQARAASASRLSRYLTRFSGELTILDLGCGNGWLANHLSKSEHTVIGLDRNQYELQQAARVFSSNSRILFLEADVFSAPFEPQSFDMVILASSIQYFADLHALFGLLGSYLKRQGEIHVLDSPLYHEQEVESAVERTRLYYAKLGFPEAAEQYFHHCWSSIEIFLPTMLYEPDQRWLQMMNLLRKVDSPFPWLSIPKQNIQ
jgi:ubiquinone/menaquinone biosynthesis C-methylase UbiE